jgi:hypothetical protein
MLETNHLPSSLSPKTPMTSSRRIIQISSTATNVQSGGVRYKGDLFALCDDGTVWHLEVAFINEKSHPKYGHLAEGVGWREIPSIPLPNEPPLLWSVAHQ